MKKIRFWIVILAVLLSLTVTGVVLAAVSSQDSGPEQTGNKTDAAETAPGGAYVPAPDGILATTYVYTSSVSIPIIDSTCFTTPLNVPDSFSIGDLNVGVWITHTYRSDVDMWLTSPGGTEIDLLTDADGSADNLNVLLDDSSPNLPDSTNHTAPPPWYSAWWMPDTPLAQFIGENPQGQWVLEVCDDAGGDTGTLNSLTLFFMTDFVSIEPAAQSGQVCKGGDVLYDMTLINATGVDTAFDLSYSSVWPYVGPATSPVLADGETWDFQVSVHIPWTANAGDSDVLTVTATGGGETDSATLTTSAGVLAGWTDYSNAPRAVRAPSIVYHDGKLYKIGGYDGAAQAYLDIYDIATDSWTPGADMPGARYWLNCEAIGDGIYCAGGYSTSGQTTLYRYDIPGNSWTTLAAMSSYRYDYASAVLNGKYYIIGGYGAAYQPTLWEYDPATNTWNYGLPSMTTGRRYAAAGVIGGKIYVAGGYSPSYLNSVEIYDPVANSWSAGPTMPTTWLYAADGVKHDRYLILAGGDDNSTGAASNLVWVLDTVTGTWSQGPNMDHALYGAEGDSDGSNFWVVTGRLYEGGVYSYSPYTTLLDQCDETCTPVSGLDFTWDPLEPWTNNPVTFDASATAGSLPIYFDWDFGDGGIGAGPTVEHTYLFTDTYTVDLAATNCDGASTDTASHDVTVIQAPTIMVDPTSLHAIHLPDQVTTQTLEICNVGDDLLTWELAEDLSPLNVEGIGEEWEIMAPLPAGRVFNAVVAEGPYVYVIGGTSDAGGLTPTDTLYRYDTNANTWSTLTSAPTTLSSIDGIAIGGKIYVPGDGVTSTTYVYDIAAGTWSSIPTNNGYPAIEQYQVVAIGTDLYVLGGITGGASTTAVWKLDTLTSTWSVGIPMLKSLTSFSATAVGSNIYVAGGVAYPGFTPDMTAEMFDGTSWSYIAPVPDGGGAYTRWSYNADGVSEGNLWLAGGRRDTDWAVLDHAGYYNPATDSWTDSPTIPILNQGRVYMEGDVAEDGYFYVIGGRDSAGTIVYTDNERLRLVDFDLPWVSEAPITGTLPGGACELLDVTFDSTGLDLGEYHGLFEISSNDPVMPQFDVPVSLTVVPLADLEVTKTDAEDPVYAGLEIDYTINVTNNGPTSSPGAVVTDTLPTNFFFVAASPGCTQDANVVTCTLGAMAMDETAVITITAGSPDPGTYLNMVEVVGFGDDPDLLNNTAEAETTVLPYDVNLVYYDLEDVVLDGEAVYAVGDFNGWSTTANPMTPNLDFSVFTVTLELGMRDYGYKYVVYTDTVPSGPVHWEWLQSYPDNHNRMMGITGETTIEDYRDIVPGYYELWSPDAITMTVGTTSGDIHGRLWAWGYTSEGVEPRSLLAELGFGTDVDPAAWTSWADMTWDSQVGNDADHVGNITPTELGVFSYAVRYNANWGVGNPNNLWYYADTNWDAMYNPDDAGVLTVVDTAGEADLSVVKTGPATVEAGATFTYTLTVANAEPDVAANVVLVDTLPEGVTFVSATTPCEEVEGVVTCELGDIGSGGSVEIEVVVTAPATAGTLTNEAAVTSDTLDPDETDNADSLDTVVEVGEVVYHTFLSIVFK